MLQRTPTLQLIIRAILAVSEIRVPWLATRGTIYLFARYTASQYLLSVAMVFNMHLNAGRKRALSLVHLPWCCQVCDNMANGRAV